MPDFLRWIIAGVTSVVVAGLMFLLATVGIVVAFFVFLVLFVVFGLAMRRARKNVQYGEDGGAVLTARQEKGGVFGDLLMAAGQASPLSLVASAEGAAVLFLPLEGILSDCGRGCACHVALRRNLLAETASKFWGLRQRVAYLTEPQLRRRILLFLRDRREAAGSDYFRVPYSRQEMAEVLGVNRSALSRELGRMQREGLLEFYRSSFRLKNV